MAVSTKTRLRQAAEALLNVSSGSAAVSLRPVTSGGCSTYKKLGLTATKDEVKGSAGQIYSITLQNINAAVRYVKFVDATAANTTVGTTAVKLTLGMPATSSVTHTFPNGIAFANGITMYSVTELADNGTTGASANETVVNITYK